MSKATDLRAIADQRGDTAYDKCISQATQAANEGNFQVVVELGVGAHPQLNRVVQQLEDVDDGFEVVVSRGATTTLTLTW